MKKWIVLIIAAIALLTGGLFAAKTAAESAVEAVLAEQAMLQTTASTEATETLPASTETEEPTVVITEAPTEPATEATAEPTTEATASYVLFFTEEEEELLLKIGMAERGESGCTECVALVMRTVLNRVESPKFSSTIKGVIYAQDQFTPVAEGTFEDADPNAICANALEMIKQGWDESQGALYYEWCDGPSWHSQNLNLLLQHCDVRFYN